MTELSEEEIQLLNKEPEVMKAVVRDNDVLTYSKEEMQKLRESKLSRTRPENLAVQYNGDDGLFSPLLWIQHRWECDGVKNRPNTRKNDLLKEDLDSTVLSPQRRGFSSGCRAPEDKATEEEGGGEAKRSGWRGAAPKREDYTKQSFDRPRRSAANAVGQGGGAVPLWRSSDARNDSKLTGKQGYGFGGRNGGRREEEKVERLPEWADTHTTLNDMIELKGFDDTFKKREVKGRAPGKEEKTIQRGHKKNGEISTVAGARPTSRPSLSNEQVQSEEKKSATSVIPSEEVISQFTKGFEHKKSTPIHIPSSDEEFAKILGLLDNTSLNGNDQNGILSDKTDFLSDLMSSGVNEEPSAVTGSRLSRFFQSPADHGKTLDSAEKQYSHVMGRPLNAESMGSALLFPIPPPPSARYEHEIKASLTGSARDFSPSASHQLHHPQTPATAPSSAAEHKSMMARIFENTEETSQQQRMTTALHGNHAMALAAAGERQSRGVTLEDIEKDFVQNTSKVSNEMLRAQQQAAVKGNPLGDPREQATLLQKLKRVAQEQESSTSGASASLQMPPIPVAAISPVVRQVGIPPSNPMVVQALLGASPMPHDPQMIVAATIASQHYHVALLQAASYLNGRVPPEIQENIHKAAVKKMYEAHGLLMRDAASAQQQQQQQESSRPVVTRPTNLIPASVQKQMAKSAASTSAAEKTERVPREADTEPKRQIVTQQQYGMIVNAMQSGFPMSSWRQIQQPPVSSAAGGTQPVASGANPAAAVAAFNQSSTSSSLVNQIEQRQQIAAFMALTRQQTQQQQLAKLFLLQQAQQQQQAGLLQGQQPNLGPTVGDVAPSCRAPMVPPPVPAAAVMQAPSRSQQMSREDPTSAPIQNPLEKLLAAAGVQARSSNDNARGQQHLGHNNYNRLSHEQAVSQPAHGAVPPAPPAGVLLEELERRLTESK